MRASADIEANSGLDSFGDIMPIFEIYGTTTSDLKEQGHVLTMATAPVSHPFFPFVVIVG